MRTTEKIKLESWLTRYDFWLDSRGVPLGVRSALGKEMRSNLTEAAADVGLDEALAGAGSPKELATEAAEVAVDPTRPTWLQGLGWAVAAAVGYGLIVLISLLTFTQGVFASGAERATGWALLAPGVQIDVVNTEAEVSMGASGFPWLLPAVALLGFLIGARVWRLAIPADERRERVRLPRSTPETGPRWGWGAVAAVVTVALLSVEFRADDDSVLVTLNPTDSWLFALVGALVAFALVAQPWRARRT